MDPLSMPSLDQVAGRHERTSRGEMSSESPKPLLLGKKLVFESPVSRPEKDRNWTGLDQKKDWTAVLVFHI